MSHIRFAVPADTEQIKNIWRVCFNDSEAFLDWNFSRNYSPENTLLCEMNGKIVSDLQMIPYALSIGGAPAGADYISGAATLPEYRGRGIMGELLRRSFEESRRRGHELSFLVPARAEFYEKFGYKFYWFRRKHSCNQADLRGFESSGNMEPLGLGNIDALLRLYRAFAGPYDGYALRTRENFRPVLEDHLWISNGEIFAHRGSGGELDGYVMYYFYNGKLMVNEIAWLNAAALHSMLFHISGAGSGGLPVEIITPAGVDLCGGIASETLPFAMAKPLSEVGGKALWLFTFGNTHQNFVNLLLE